MASPASQTHAIILLGTSAPGDGWMLADADKIAWIVHDISGDSHFLAPQPLEQYDGSSNEGYIVGDPNSDRLLIPHPTRGVEIIREPAALKAAFLQRLSTLSTKMRNHDILFVAFLSHGRQTDGAIVIGDMDSDEPNCDYISVAEFKHALRNKPESGRLSVWAGTGHPSFSIQKSASAASHIQDSNLAPGSTSSASQHTCPVHRPLPMPSFKSKALARLRLIPCETAPPSAIGTFDSPSVRTASALQVRGLCKSDFESIIHSTGVDLLRRPIPGSSGGICLGRAPRSLL